MPTNPPPVCQRIRIHGLVQGLGFRPLIYRIATSLSLQGSVRNDAQGILIEACGAPQAIDTLIERIQNEAPPRAHIDSITTRLGSNTIPRGDFLILDNVGGRSSTMIGPDMAVCPRCLSEIFQKDNRRWRHAFTHCHQCGPRYTLCSALPFDRRHTSLHAFNMCHKCALEYESPHDRRFHLQTNLCPKCGPRLTLLDAHGKPLRGDPIALAYAKIIAGEIIAIKSPGGFHLIGDARNTKTVRRLRDRKQQASKPFPLMFANTASVTTYVHFGMGDPGLLTLPERPIIQLRKRKKSDTHLPEIAPKLPWLGVVLPFSPLHYLLFHEAQGRPEGLGWLDAPQELILLLESSAQEKSPPLFRNADALSALSGLVDGFLMHNRDIEAPCDDSIARPGSHGLQLIRRARGYVPVPFKLPFNTPSILATGSPRHTTLCITRGHEAFVSEYLGNTKAANALPHLEYSMQRLLRLLDVSPALIAHDPTHDPAINAWIADFARTYHIPCITVPRYAAYPAAIIAEQGLLDPVFALILDAGGLGGDTEDSEGGLFYIHDSMITHHAKLLHFPIPLDAGYAPRPKAIAAALLAWLTEPTQHCKPTAPTQNILKEAPTLTRTSRSLLRFLEGMAALLGFCPPTPEDEDQALRDLDGAAETYGEAPPRQEAWRLDDGVLDLRPLIEALLEDPEPKHAAATLYRTLGEAIAAWLSHHLKPRETLILSGSVLDKPVLANTLRERISARGFNIIEAKRIPPNDSGISLGQAFIAQHILREKRPKARRRTL